MARPVRIEYPGAFYHVMNRGQRQAAIYEDDADRQRFVLGLGRMCRQFGTRIHAYCLMNNHYHLILETPDANLSRAMQWG
jgi:REP element-mobilizing transposase RayT